MSDPIVCDEMKLEGGWLMLKPSREEYGKAMALARNHKGGQIDLDVKKHKKDRSLNANKFMWHLLRELSGVMRIPPMELYRGYIKDVGDNFEILAIKEDKVVDWNRHWCKGHYGRCTMDMGPCRTIPGYHYVMTFLSSSDYDVSQMSRLLDLIIEDCRSVGIEVMSERERSLLLEEWANA